MEKAEFDVIVVGAGSTGENIADRASQGGLSVAIVENDLVGGDCSYWACMPSKALLRPGEAVRAAQGVGGARQAVTGEVDVGEVLSRRDSFASQWDDSGQVEWLEGAGLTLVRGRGRITGVREVTVDSDAGPRVLRARSAVAVATGSDPAIPDVEGLRQAQPWTSREATSAKEVPASLVVLGGGVVACELATAFLDLGAEVTLVARSGLLKQMEPFAGEAVAGRLRERGAELLLETPIRRVTRGTHGVTVETEEGRTIEAAQVLVAMGRKPRTNHLGLATVGLRDGEYLDVDDTMRVRGVDWLYAAGDVINRAQLTHQGKYQARVTGDVITARATGGHLDAQAWGRHATTADHVAVPQVVFSDPQVAMVGHTEKSAREALVNVRVVTTPLGDVAGAGLHRDDYEGTAAMVVDEDLGTIVGMTLVGPDVAELLHAATIAVVGQVSLARLWHAVPAYPTVSEFWLRLLEAYRS